MQLDQNGHVEQGPTIGLTDFAIVLLDEDGLVESWSKGAEVLFGHPPEDVLGHRVSTLLVADDAARLPALAEQCRQRGSWSGLLSVRHLNGDILSVEVQAEIVTESDGRTRWLALAVDEPLAREGALSRVVLERMVMHSPVGMAVVDTDLRFVWSNRALETFGGGSPRNRIGRRLADVQPGLSSEALESRMRNVLTTGVPVVGYEHVGRPTSDPENDHAHAMSFVRLDDVNGDAFGVCYTVVDITDRYRSRQRVALLNKAGEYIGRTLDVAQTAQDLADVAVPQLADFVVVDLLDSVLKGGDPLPGPVDDAETVAMRRSGRRTAVDGVPPVIVPTGDIVTYHAWSPPIRCLADGTSWRSEQLETGVDWAAHLTPDQRGALRELGTHTAMVVPIRARNTTMGVAMFFRIRRKEPFSAEDLRFAEEFVARAAVCMDNARRYTREREAALSLQRSLLPHSLPRQEAVHVASAYRPADELADVGGNWFDVIALSGARVALVVGDVTGHGLDAVAAMGRLRTAVQTLAALDLRPEELLARLDDLVSLSDDQDLHPPSSGSGTLGTSCLYAVYDPVGRTCTMASAGNPPPAVIAPDGTGRFVDVPVGPRLGAGGLPFEAVEVPVEEGSILALYTHGLIAGDTPEQADPQGRERLRQVLESPGLTLDALCERVIDHLAPARPIDDVTLMLAGTRGLSTDRYASWDLPTDPAVVSRAREMANRQLASWGLDELAFTTELAVSELVTNAIRYASGPIRLRLLLTHTLTCEVFDGSSTAPYLRHPRATDEGGRGLFMISQFTHRWGTRYTPEGKIIWTEQLLDSGHEPEDPSGTAFGDEAASFAV